MEIHDKFYKGYLKRLFEKLEIGIKMANKANNTKAAYMFLAIRDVDDPYGNIDIISNITTATIKRMLEATLNAVNRELQTKGSKK